jgi:hypothetical protein
MKGGKQMKRKLLAIFAVLAIVSGAFAISASSTSTEVEDCPLRGTQACPEYPTCCK